MSVCGDQRSRGTGLDAADSTTRSRRRSSGRFTVRRSTLSWCCCTAFSTSRAQATEPPTTSRTDRRTSRYSKKSDTRPILCNRIGRIQVFRALQALIATTVVVALLAAAAARV
jgi:hypothetical protein